MAILILLIIGCLDFILVLNRVSHDPLSGLRLVVFLCFAVSALYRPKWSLYVLVASLPCWEIPLLRSGFINSFMSDIGVLGFTNGLMIRDWISSGRRVSSLRSEKSTPLFVAVLGLIVAFLVATSISTLVQIASLSNWDFSFFNVLKSLPRFIYNWDIAGHWYHNLTVTIGLLIHLVWLLTLLIHHHEEDQVYTMMGLNRAIVVGVVVNVGYALVQQFFPHIAPVKPFSVNFGGLLQNGNLLSFLAGLGSLITVRLWLEDKTSRSARLYPILFGFQLYGVILGQGRLPLVSLVLCLIFMGFCSSRRVKVSRRILQFNLLFVVIMIGVINLVAQEKWGQFFRQIFGAIETRHFEKVFLQNGRDEIFSKAWSITLKFPWTGVGLYSFFDKAGLKYEPHNIFLVFSSGGGLILTTVILGIFLYWLVHATKAVVVKNFHLRDSYIYCIILYCFLVCLGDAPYSYRSLLAIVEVIVIAHWIQKPELFPLHRYASVLPLLGFLIALPTFVSPQTWFLVDQGYGEEVGTIFKNDRSLENQFEWHSLASVQLIAPNTCHFFSLRSGIESDGAAFVVSILPNNPIVRDSTVSQLLSLEKTFKKTNLIPADIVNGTNVCFCSRPSAEVPSWVYIRSTNAWVPGFSRSRFNYDLRLLGFAERETLVRDRLPDDGIDNHCLSD